MSGKNKLSSPAELAELQGEIHSVLWGQGMGLAVKDGKLVVTNQRRPQSAPSASPPPIVNGSPTRNRASARTAVAQQGGGAPTAYKPRTALPAAPSAHTSGWAPGARAAASARGHVMEGIRDANQEQGRPALWGDLHPRSDPRNEAYYQEADIQQWGNANQPLLQALRRRYGLPELSKNSDGSLNFNSGTVSPYATAFSTNNQSPARGFELQTQLVNTPDVSGVSFPSEAPANTVAAFNMPSVATPVSMERPGSISPEAYRAAMAGYQGSAPLATSAQVQAPAGMMAPIDMDARMAGFRGEGLEKDFLKRFMLGNQKR